VTNNNGIIMDKETVKALSEAYDRMHGRDKGAANGASGQRPEDESLRRSLL
jgi:hypothetical protein